MLITIVTICYNAEKELGSTMKSVLEQTFEDYEYIIIDGRSKDKTLEIAYKTQAEFPNKNVKIVSEPDKGIYDAMNKGVKLASGEWICMMNAGDMFASKGVLSEIFNSPIPNHITFLYSDFYKATSYGKYFKVTTCCNEKKRILVHQSTIYRCNLHKEHGFYIVTPKLTVSDYLFFMRIPLEETMKVDTVIAKYEGGGISEQGGWCKQLLICTDVVFRTGNFWMIQYKYLAWRIKTLLPKKIREWIRVKQSGVER